MTVSCLDNTDIQKLESFIVKQKVLWPMVRWSCWQWWSSSSSACSHKAHKGWINFHLSSSSWLLLLLLLTTYKDTKEKLLTTIIERTAQCSMSAPPEPLRHHDKLSCSSLSIVHAFENFYSTWWEFLRKITHFYMHTRVVSYPLNDVFAKKSKN